MPEIVPYLPLIAAGVGAGAQIYSANKQSEAAESQEQLAREAMNKKPFDMLTPEQQQMYPILFSRVLQKLNSPPPAYRGQLSVGYTTRPSFNMSPPVPTPVEPSVPVQTPTPSPIPANIPRPWRTNRALPYAISDGEPFGGRDEATMTREEIEDLKRRRR